LNKEISLNIDWSSGSCVFVDQRNDIFLPHGRHDGRLANHEGEMIRMVLLLEHQATVSLEVSGSVSDVNWVSQVVHVARQKGSRDTVVLLESNHGRFICAILLLVANSAVVVELHLTRVNLLSVVDERAVTGTGRQIGHEGSESLRVVDSIVVENTGHRFADTTEEVAESVKGLHGNGHGSPPVEAFEDVEHQKLDFLDLGSSEPDRFAGDIGGASDGSDHYSKIDVALNEILGLRQRASQEHLGGSFRMTHVAHLLLASLGFDKCDDRGQVVESHILLVEIPERHVLSVESFVGVRVFGPAVVAQPDIVPSTGDNESRSRFSRVSDPLHHVTVLAVHH